MSAIQVQFTVNDEAIGISIADALVEGRLVACCQKLGPVTSTYWWEGRKQSAEEWLFLAKTTDERFDAVAAVIQQLHPYDVPEVVATPIVTGTATYLAWIETEVR